MFAQPEETQLREQFPSVHLARSLVMLVCSHCSCPSGSLSSTSGRVIWCGYWFRWNEYFQNHSVPLWHNSNLSKKRQLSRCDGRKKIYFTPELVTHTHYIPGKDDSVVVSRRGYSQGKCRNRDAIVAAGNLPKCRVLMDFKCSSFVTIESRKSTSF